jgi:hypothetical protein
MIDPAPLQQPISEMQSKTLGSLTRVWTNWFNSIYGILFNVQLYDVEALYVPVAGFNYQIPAAVGVFLMQPAAVLATGTLQLPQNPVNRQRIEVSSSQTITALTVTATGKTILNAPTTLVGGSGFAYLYRSTTTTWHRVY